MRKLYSTSGAAIDSYDGLLQVGAINDPPWDTGSRQRMCKVVLHNGSVFWSSG